MPGIAFAQMNALPDTMSTDRFQILIVPGGTIGNQPILQLRCQQIVVPETSIEPMLLQIHGMEFNFRGRRVYDKTLGASFIETSDHLTSDTIRSWMENICGTNSNDSEAGGKQTYVTQGRLDIFDQSGNIALTYFFDNLWPSQLPQVQLDGTNATPYIVQVTFTFDRMYLNSVPVQ